MVISSLLLLLTVQSAISASIPTDVFNVKCYFIYNWAVFDMNPASSILDPSFDTLAFKNVYNFCKDVNYTCPGRNDTSQFISSGPTCYNMAGSAKQANKWALIDPKNSSNGLSITLNPGDKCITGGNTTVVMNITCDRNTNGVVFSNQASFNPLACNNTLLGKSKHVCPVLDLYVVAEFIDTYKYYLGFAMVALGVILTFFGAKFIVLTVYIGCILITLSVAFILVFDIILKNTTASESLVWIIGGVAIVVGLILGYLFNQMIKLFFTIFGAYLGYVVGIILYNMFLHNINADQRYVYWGSIAVCAVIFIILSFILFEYIVIFSTSFIGAYLAVRGVSLYAGGFPDESKVINLIKAKETDELENLFTWKVYIYLGAIVLLFVLGVLVQSKFIKEENKKSGDSDKGGFYIKISNNKA